MSRVLDLLRAGLPAIGRELSVRTVQFYGGVALIGFGSTRLAIAGAVLAVHAVVGPLLVRRGG